MNHILSKRAMLMLLTIFCCLGSWAIDEKGRYFVQDFEDQTTYPENSSAFDAEFYVAGQGTWVYTKAGLSTNSNYTNGSTANLRMPKNGSYVITPILNCGVKKVTWIQTRKEVTAYISSDGGINWTSATITSSDKLRTIEVNSLNVNRIKIANDSSGDADIDNLIVYAMVFSTPDEIQGNVIWCTPDGDDATADGSAEHPFFDLQKAVDVAQPGDRIWMKAGTYVYDKRINIDEHNGSPDKMIELYGFGGQAVLDFSGQPNHAHADNPYQGVRLTSSYWHFKNIDICNASDNGLLIERDNPTGGSASEILLRTQDAHDNIIELCNFYKNGDTGLQMMNLAANNKVINCDSYLNCDEDKGDADGFASKSSVGDNNYFYGCRAWANADDGWDVFYNKESGFGDDMTIIIENCIAYKNGFLDLNTVTPNGNGDGYKCGSDQGAMNVYMNRCLAIQNKSNGFDHNYNAGDIILNNCTGMALSSISEKPYSYRIYMPIADGHEIRLTNCIAINENDATDKRDKYGFVKPNEHGKYGQYGRFEIDETLSRITITNCEFQKAHPDFFVSVTNHEELVGARDENGNLPETTFAHIVAESSHQMYDGSTVTSEELLIDKGTPVEATTYRGIAVNGIEYLGTAPDLGAYESGDALSTGIRVVSQQSEANSVRIFQAQNGILFVSVNGSKELATYRATLYDATGRIIGQHQFSGNTTAIRLPQGANGMVVLKVEGDNGFRGSVKAIVRD